MKGTFYMKSVPSPGMYSVAVVTCKPGTANPSGAPKFTPCLL